MVTEEGRPRGVISVLDATGTIVVAHVKTPAADVMTRNPVSVTRLTLAAEALKQVPVVASTVTTPLGPAEGRVLRADVVVVPVLRAGLGMLDAVLELIPSARVGHIGLQRDETTAIASWYYSKLPPNIAGSYVLIIDPMLATGGSAVARHACAGKRLTVPSSRSPAPIRSTSSGS